MGYTHYWRNSKRLTAEFLEAANKVVENSPVHLEVFDTLWFNGIKEDGHESFVYQAGLDFSFCKTQCKPYDIVVVAVLALAAHFNLAEVSSDGNAQEWERGVELACRLTGLDVQIPSTIRGSDLYCDED